MIWYVAFIAVLNLCLGYLWAAYFRPCPRCARRRAADAIWELEASPGIVEPVKRVSAPAATPQQAAETSAESPAQDLDQNAEENINASPLEAPQDESVVAPKRSPLELAMPLDPKTGLLTREHVEWLLEQMSTNSSRTGPVTIGLMEIAAPEWFEGISSPEGDERLLCGVSNIVRQTLGDEQTAARYTNQQILLLVPDEGMEQAMRRAEEIRQRVATTEFTADGQAFQATLTCALTEVTQERSGPKLFEFLQEALDEAKRYGGNRTFMHDGNSPTPVVPPELEIESQNLAI